MSLVVVGVGLGLVVVVVQVGLERELDWLSPPLEATVMEITPLQLAVEGQEQHPMVVMEYQGQTQYLALLLQRAVEVGLTTWLAQVVDLVAERGGVQFQGVLEIHQAHLQAKETTEDQAPLQAHLITQQQAVAVLVQWVETLLGQLLVQVVLEQHLPFPARL